MMDIADGLKMVLEELRAGGMMKYEQYSRLYDEVERLRNEHSDDNNTGVAEPGNDDFVRRGDVLKAFSDWGLMGKFFKSECTLRDIIRAVPAADVRIARLCKDCGGAFPGDCEGTVNCINFGRVGENWFCAEWCEKENNGNG